MRRGAVVALGAMLVCLAGMVAACNTAGEQEMYQQIRAGQRDTAKPGSDTTGASGTPGLPGTPAAAAEPAADAQQVPVLRVTVDDREGGDPEGEPLMTVKAPYPEYTGEGRYEVRITIITEQYREAQVYRIVALDAQGEEVGSQERHLALPVGQSRSFVFSGFYCKSAPVAIELYETSKEAKSAEEGAEGDEEGGGSGAGSGGGGGSKPGSTGRGISTGGGGSSSKEDSGE